MLIKEFNKKDKNILTVRALGEDNTISKIPLEEIEWIARIVWVSQ
jgi:phage repressor protein C with HTH and peptisase S24 domain